MTIIFYYYSGDDIIVDKISKLTELKTFNNCLFKQPTSLIAPYMTINLITSEPYNDFGNYCYIEELDKYYFIVDIISLNNTLWGLQLKEDVLMSFRFNIKNLNAYITRQENTYNKYIVDEQEPVIPQCEVSVDLARNINGTVQSFVRGGSGGTDFVYIINTIGNSNVYSSRTMQNNTIIPIPNGNVSPVGKTVKTYITEDLSFISKILEEIINDTAFASYITGIYVAPMSSTYFTDIGNRVFNAKIGNKTFNFSANEKPTYLLNADSYLIREFSISLNSLMLNSWKDYEPYSLYELYIPYYGWYKLDNRLLQTYPQNIIEIRYVFDFTNGTATIQLYDNAVKNIIDTLSCEYFSPIPVNSTTAGQLERESNAAGIRLIAGTLSAATSAVKTVVGGVIAGGASAAIGGLSNVGTIPQQAGNIHQNATVGQSVASAVGSGVNGLIGTVADALIFNATAVTYGQKDNIKSIWTKYFCCYNFLRRVTRNTFLNDEQIAQFAHFKGRPLYENRRLGSLTGFTQINDIHLDDIPATESEKQLLFNTLKNGVIL